MSDRTIEPASLASPGYFENFGGHTQIHFQWFGPNWYCVTCYQNGSNYDGDSHLDKPCVPRAMPDDWNWIYA